MGDEKSLMETLRKSFKSHGSYKHMRRISAVEDQEEEIEEQPILFDHDTMMSSMNDLKEVVVKIDGNIRDVELAMEPNKNNSNNGNTIWRESSYDFWKDEGKNGNGNGNENASATTGDSRDDFNFQKQGVIGDDPPSKLIGQFLNMQKDAGAVTLDMDMGMDELRYDRNLPPITESPGNGPPPLSSKELRVSFHRPAPGRVEIDPEPIQRHYKESSDDEDHHGHGRGNSSSSGQILRCTSNASFRPTSALSRIKTKSRLMDPPEEKGGRKSGGMKSGQLKSGFLGKINDEDDEDPFAGEDLPDDFKNGNFECLTILQWVSLVFILIAFICSFLIPSLVKKRMWGLHLWKWELLILVLICGRLVSGWGIRIVVFFIERNFLLRKRVLYFVYGVRKPVQNCLWLGLVLVAWHFMFDQKVEKDVINNKALPYVTKVLICFLVGTLIWLVKTLLVKVLASSFHVSAYFDRIQDSLFNQYVIETLSGPPLLEFQQIHEDEEKVMSEVEKLQNAGVSVPMNFKDTAFTTMKSGRVIGGGGLRRNSMIGKSIKYSGAISKRHDEGITIDHLHKLNQKNVSAWNMKRLINIVRHGVLETLDEKVLGSVHEDESTKIRSEIEAKAAAKKIFINVAKHRSKYIYLEDLLRFMRDDEAQKTMGLFEGAQENERVNKSALKSWVVNAFRERRALALTLNDTKTAVNKLHHIINMVVSILIGVVWLLILGIATTHLLVFISSQLLLVVFIFGNTCKMIFEAIIFLFVMHPFDVGDRCEVDGVQMVVEEMNILTTVFLRYDNQKIYYPNSVLSTMPISNYYRSPDMGDSIDFCIHISTPTEKIAIMKQRITGYIESKKDHWNPSPMVVVKEVEEMNKVKMSVWLSHRMNHQNMGERWSRRAGVVEEMINVFRDLTIDYRMLPVDVNVRNMPALSSTRLPSNWSACA
ncbi:hypothetical protein GIB67_023566 [Kingdonia uniflora]|uniref:Mechanosensitive ion channel protein n=1 Tax=Kingdonia uniflora TaxID=39325 RepID=A0A7J7P9X9_9MAGN|nr:hypothetical protein GIB67_023566 [Kingdonia uniflora]